MRSKLITAVCACFVASGVVAEPRLLSEESLDSVSAGAVAFGFSIAEGVGSIIKTDSRVAGASSSSQEQAPGSGLTSGVAASASFARVDPNGGVGATGTSAVTSAPEGNGTHQFSFHANIPGGSGTSTSVSASFSRSYIRNPLLP